MTEPATFRLGQQVEDRVTGFAGTITSIIEHAAGYTQYAVTPRSADPASFPEAVMFDPHTLKLIDEGMADELPEHDEYPDLKFGALVRDKYSDFKGTITARQYCMNGCVQVLLTTNVNKDGKTHLEVLNANSVELVRAVKEEPPRKKTGPTPKRGRYVATR